MVALTPPEIAWLLRRNAMYQVDGYPKIRPQWHATIGWPTAIAIIMAESGGNPNAHNSTPPDDSYGLAQINMYGDLGPARRAQFGLRRNEDLFLANVNLGVMGMISNGGIYWRPWSTYTSGAYKRHMPAAQAAVRNPVDPGSKLQELTSEELSEENRDKTALENFQDWVGAGVMRGAAFVGGAALLIGAVVLVGKKGIK